jgi:type IV fimbrial biogenesis protein FimT
MARPARGFTLIELLFVVTLIGIMIAIAVPSFASFIANYRATSAVNDVLQAMTLARAEAMKQSRRIIILPNDSTGNPIKTGSWSNGWTVFADLNNNQTYDSASEAATVISKHAAFPTSTTFAAPASPATGIFGGANYVQFDGTGYPHTSATGTLGGVAITDTVGSKNSVRTLCMAVLGRPRIVNGPDGCTTG